MSYVVQECAELSQRWLPAWSASRTLRLLQKLKRIYELNPQASEQAQIFCSSDDRTAYISNHVVSYHQGNCWYFCRILTALLLLHWGYWADYQYMNIVKRTYSRRGSSYSNTNKREMSRPRTISGCITTVVKVRTDNWIWLEGGGGGGSHFVTPAESMIYPACFEASIGTCLRTKKRKNRSLSGNIQEISGVEMKTYKQNACERYLAISRDRKQNCPVPFRY